jgi:hypothetical protein
MGSAGAPRTSFPATGLLCAARRPDMAGSGPCTQGPQVVSELVVGLDFPQIYGTWSAPWDHPCKL